MLDDEQSIYEVESACRHSDVESDEDNTSSKSDTESESLVPLRVRLNFPTRAKSDDSEMNAAPAICSAQTKRRKKDRQWHRQKNDNLVRIPFDVDKTKFFNSCMLKLVDYFRSMVTTSMIEFVAAETITCVFQITQKDEKVSAFDIEIFIALIMTMRIISLPSVRDYFSVQSCIQ